jgi:peptidyl-prolyl cis-trans isomerase SurA
VKLMQPSRPRPAALVGLALAALALTGCGPSLGINPGAAAVVGDRSLSMRTIDSTSTLYCEALVPLIKQNAPTGLPLSLVRQQVTANLTERLLGEQLAAQYDVQPSSEYAAAVANIRQQFGAASPDALEAGINVAGGDPYLKTVQLAVGRKLLAEAGQTSPSDKAAFARGQVATEDWLKDHHIKVDPSLGVTFSKAAPVFKRDQTSYPVSPLASQGMVDPSKGPDPAYTAALPASQVCG